MKMCIAVPGKVTRIESNVLGMTIGTVAFGGISKDVSLAYLPDVAVGDYVLVHVGFAIARVNEQGAAEVFEFLKLNSELEKGSAI
jgi:hydrogenase expression/formation protein HypC